MQKGESFVKVGVKSDIVEELIYKLILDYLGLARRSDFSKMYFHMLFF